MKKPIPLWLKAVVHGFILIVAVLMSATQLPGVFQKLGLTEAAHYTTFAISVAGVIGAYVLKSPFVLGWLSMHDPEDVALVAKQAALQAAQTEDTKP
jgi:hypothetical protein